MRSRRNKGFTLIELLAVILILGVIALIAIPTISSIIVDSKQGAFKSSVQNLVSAAETKCQIEQMKGTVLTRLYVFSSDGVSPKLDVKGDIPTSGSIALNDNCEVVASLTDDDFTVKKNLINDEYTVSNGNSANNNLVAPINSKTKKNEFFLSPGSIPAESINGMAQYVDDNDLKNFILSATVSGYNFYLDSNNAVLGMFEFLAIPNIYPREVATDYASRVIDSLMIKAVELNTNYDGYYYVTNDYIYLMEGSKEIVDDTLRQNIQGAYDELLTNYNEMGFQYIKIEY